MSEIKGAVTRRGVSVEVHPGGAMTALTLTPAALELGAAALAAAVVDAVSEATALANQRTKHALREALVGLDLPSLAHSTALTERVESTVPDTWRAS